MPLRVRPLVAAATAAAGVLLVVPAAGAHVSPAVTIAGPDPAIIDLGRVAMAPDGTGGVVYRRTVDGAPHVYAARYDGERWQPPQRVDLGQRFTSTWPQIGAANDGRLVVTWVQQGPPNQDTMYSAVLPRNASRFQAPTVVDFTIGDSRAAYPDLAMAPGGDALLVYQQPSAFSDPLLGTAYIKSQITMARFNGSRWSGLGVPVNRIPTAPLKVPTAANAPKVAIGADGSAIVAWQEPDETLQDRVWARRVFGARLGVVQPVSPTTADGRPARGAADALDVAVTDNGRAVVALRQQPDPTQRGQAARIWTNQLDEPESGAGATFGGAQPISSADPASTGAPQVATGGRFGLLVGWTRSGTGLLAQGTGPSAGTTVALGASPDAPAPVLTQGVEGRGTVATASAEGGGRVLVRELDGARITATQGVSGSQGGPVDGLSIAGAGNGNALVGFSQGDPDERQIAVARVDAPPVPFVVEPPTEWTNAARPEIFWQAPPNDPRPRHYTVRIDGRVVARTIYGRSLRLKAGALADGPHSVQVSASSRTGGGDTETPAGTFSTDRRRPSVHFSRKGRKVLVRVVDPGAGAASGPAEGGTTIDWGDEQTADDVTASADHAYAKTATVTVVVRAQDTAGNVTTVRRKLRVRGPAKGRGGTSRKGGDEPLDGPDVQSTRSKVPGRAGPSATTTTEP